MWWLAACNEFALDPTDPPPPDARAAVTETFVQAPVAPVDLLFVVDDTASMGAEQAALGAAFAPLVGALDDSLVSWQIGVVAGTDASAGRLVGAPFVLTAATPDVADVLPVRLQVGTGGRPPEAAFATALLALDEAAEGGANAGFRRPDAALHVIFVSDDDDHSDATLGDDPTSAFLARLAAQGAATVSAASGDVPFGCTSATSTARAGQRYAEAVRATGGVFQSICAPSFDALAARVLAATVAPAERFALGRVPEPGSVGVTVDGAPLEDGFAVVLEGDVAWLVFDVPPDVGAAIVVRYVVTVPA